MILKKHPRIPHVPWSPGFQPRGPKPDLKLSSIARFKKQFVVITVKMDGMNSSMYNNWIHARSTEFLMRHGATDLVKSMWSKIRHDIPDGWRICGENLHAKHSIHYQNLPAFFLVHSVWDEKQRCLPWCETAEWAELLGFETVPVVYCGLYEHNIIRNLEIDKYLGDECEGWVMRLSDGFDHNGSHLCMAKYVRENHIPLVDANSHWSKKPIVRNERRS
jgi:hypothetical protein